jgi:HAD superfamily hydrolase (TIGR01509 family)
VARVRAVLLDVDGTLIDSNAAHAAAYVEAGRELGIALDPRAVRDRIGKGGDKLVPEVSGRRKDSPEGHALNERKKAIFAERYLPTLRPTPGARALLERLRDEGLIRIVATSASREDLEKLLRQAGITDLIQGATSADDAAASKPAPDIVQAALALTGCSPEEVLMLGDTPYDVKASRRAGVRVIAVRCGGWTDAELAGANAIFEDPQELLNHLDVLLRRPAGEHAPAP